MMMTLKARFLAVWLAAVSALWTPAHATPIPFKAVRVEHGRPIVIASEKSVLLLEFTGEKPEEALVRESEADIRHCRSHYHYQIYSRADDRVTQGQGVVEEILQTVKRTPAGNEVKDLGSRTQIEAGEFHLLWSEATAGARSWVYYRADSTVRFIQQPRGLEYAAIDAGRLRRYLDSRNVEELVTATHTFRVIGPAVFNGDLPDETKAAGRISEIRYDDSRLKLKFQDLTVNQTYVIESSFDLKPGNWNVVHTFTAREQTLDWSDPIAANINAAFYRIRQGK